MNAREKTLVILILIALGAAYTIIVSSHWSEAYIDFGDGNYLYISSRIADGLMLYRDILSPQPPLHLFLGAVVIKLGRLVNSPLYAARTFSLLLHLATMVLIFLLARKMTKSIAASLLASLFYLIIPIGFWWTLGYQSEPLLIFFLLLSFYFYIDFQPGKMALSSLIATLAAYTNMTAIPYIAFNHFYLLVRQRKLWKYYLIPMLTLAIVLLIGLELITGGHYLENVFLNQVGTFPKKELSGQSVFKYAIQKIAREGKDILFWEGGFILLGLLGLITFLRGDKKTNQPINQSTNFYEYIGWYALLSLGSVVFVSKGATMDYIFTIGEPFVAIFAAYLIVFVINEYLKGQKISLSYTAGLVAVISLALVLLVSSVIGIFFISNTLKQKNYEHPATEVRKIRYYIERYTQPGDTILSPPYYAFLTGRKIVEEYSSVFIWTIKYWNEKKVFKQDGQGVAKALKIARAIQNKQLPLIILDLVQTGNIPPIRQAIEQTYQPLISTPIQTLNTRLLLFVPQK